MNLIRDDGVVSYIYLDMCSMIVGSAHVMSIGYRRRVQFKNSLISSYFYVESPYKLECKSAVSIRAYPIRVARRHKVECDSVPLNSASRYLS